MNKSYRIRTEVGTNADKNIKLKLEQEVDTFEILSLKIDQKDIYEAFNCDYGMIIGRVNANDSVGIPNVKISIFIPISDDDKQNAEIRAIYPYENPRDKNVTGKRYNLLPRVAQVQVDGTVRPKQPFGTFPTKEEVVTNNSWLEVYDKYYKFSTVTNQSGDYMLFGVPVGTQTVHMSVDITDIGQFSMTPATMVTNLGYSPNLFTDNGTKIKPSNDLDDLPNIETQEITVDVIPFCGDDEIFDIGITRQDFRIRAELISTFTIFGSGFTNGDEEMWMQNIDNDNHRVYEFYREFNLSRHIATNRAAEITEQIFYYPSNVTDAQIADPNSDPIEERMRTLSDTEYAKFLHDGDFVYIIPCNRNKVITNEEGVLVPVSDDNPAGAFTKFKGFLTLEISTDTLPMNFSGTLKGLLGNNHDFVPVRYKYKFPQQSTTLGQVLEHDDDAPNINAWRKQHHTFELDKIYSVAKFYPTISNTSDSKNNDGYIGQHGLANNSHSYDVPNQLLAGETMKFNIGQITTANEPNIPNAEKQFPSNKTGQFGGNWMNMSIYFVQNGRLIGLGVQERGDLVTNTHFLSNAERTFHFIDSNTQPIAASVLNTQWFPRTDLHFTDIIEIPKDDIINMNKFTKKGFKNTEFGALTGGESLLDPTIYMNGQDTVPVGLSGDKSHGSGKINADPNETVDTDYYFYKGLDDSNCTQFIADLGLV